MFSRSEAIEAIGPLGTRSAVKQPFGSNAQLLSARRTTNVDPIVALNYE
jgi:hypothetical protein